MRKTILKACGLILCLFAAALIGFTFGADRGYDTGYRMAVHDVKKALLEGHEAQYTFGLAGMEELLFFPWTKGKRPQFTIAGAGDQGMRKVK